MRTELKPRPDAVDALSMNANPAPPICIHCGLSAGSPPRLNRFEDGRVCPVCADRLLDSLPSLLPASPGAACEAPDDALADEEQVEYDSAERDQPA